MMLQADGVTARRVTAAREACGLSQKQLAEMIEVHPVTVSRWETAANSVPLPQLTRVAGATGVTVDYLLGRVAGPQDTIEERGAVGGQDAVPLNLLLTMLGLRERLTQEEFEILWQDLDPDLNPDAATAFDRTQGQWLDRIVEVRDVRSGRAKAARVQPQASVPTEKPGLRHLSDAEEAEEDTAG